MLRSGIVNPRFPTSISLSNILSDRNTSHSVRNLRGIIVRGDNDDMRLVGAAAFLVVPLLVTGGELSGAVETDVLRVGSTPPPPRLGRGERLLVHCDARSEVELPPQVAEAGVHPLVIAFLMALQGLAQAIATVALATGEPGRMARELLAERSLSDSTAWGST